MTIGQELAALTTKTQELIDAVNVKKATLDTAVSDAVTAKTASETAETNSANSAAASAQSAVDSQAILDNLGDIEIATALSEFNASQSELAAAASELAAATSETTVLASEANVTAMEANVVAKELLAAQAAINTAADVLSAATSEANALSYKNAAETANSSASTHATTAQAAAALLANYTSMTSLERALPTKAEFEAMAEERKANRSGSGFDEWGKDFGATLVNEGINVQAAATNTFFMGRDSITYGGVGDSKTDWAVSNVNGIKSKLWGIRNPNIQNEIGLPTAPTVTHADASNSGMVINGRNFVDTSGGWVGSSAILSAINGNLHITTGVSEYYGHAKYYFNENDFTTGEEYIIEFNIEKTDVYTHTPYVGIYSSDTSGDVIESVQYDEGFNLRYEIKFTFDASTMPNLQLRIHAGGQNSTLVLKSVAVFPKKELSRSDLVFLETWHEDISEKDFVYPLGNIQYLGADTDGLTGIVAGAFAGKESYSKFGNWQADNALVGKGYVWSTMSEANKIKFVSNPENNCYIDGTTIVQVRYRVRVVQGLGDEWENPFNTQAYIADTRAYVRYNNLGNNYIYAKGKNTSISDDFSGYAFGFKDRDGVEDLGHYKSERIWESYNGEHYAMPIALVHRRNQGAYHPKFNPNGVSNTKYNDIGNSTKWYEAIARKHLCIADSFDYHDAATNPSGVADTFGDIAANKSGRPDGLFYDEVNERDIIDLRNSSHKIQDYKRLLEREFNKAVSGEVRGEEGEWEVVDNVTCTLSSISQQNYIGATTSRFQLDNQSLLSEKSGYLYGTNYNEISHTIRGFIEKDDGSYSELYSVYDNGIQTLLFGMDSVTSQWTPTNTYRVIIAKKSTRKKSNTLLHCDIIGNPANYYRGQTYTNTGASQTVDVVQNETVVWNRGGDNATYKTTGALQTVTTAIGDTVYIEVASGSTGVGTVGMVYRALTVQASIDLDTENFTNGTNWAEVGLHGYFYKRVGTNSTFDLTITTYNNPSFWEDLGADWDGAGSWRTGVSGTPLVVGENGEDYIPNGQSGYKFSKKVVTWKLGLYSTDNGVTWTVWNPTRNDTTNTITDIMNNGWIFMGFYETHTNMAENAVNSEVIELGDVLAMSDTYSGVVASGILCQSLINKIIRAGANNSGLPNRYVLLDSGLLHDSSKLNTSKLPSHNQISLGTFGMGVFKTLPYITKQNNKAYLNLVFKEMKFDVDWGDDSKFNIVDNVSTTTDDNGNTVLIGQKRIELPYFIEDKE